MSKFARDFDRDLQDVNAFSHCVTLTRVLLPQIISYSDTKMLVLFVMEYNRAVLIYVYELIVLLHTSRSTEYTHTKMLRNVRNVLFQHNTGHLRIGVYCSTKNTCPLIKTTFSCSVGIAVHHSDD